MGCDLHNYYWCGAACFLGVANSPACTVHSGRSLTKPLPARGQAVDQVVEGVFETGEFGVGGGAKSEAPLRAPKPEAAQRRRGGGGGECTGVFSATGVSAGNKLPSLPC